MNYNNESLGKMLDCFSTDDLKNLLGMFGIDKRGIKSELKERALEILHSRPSTIDIQSYVATISEIYRNLQTFKPNNIVRGTMMNIRAQDIIQRPPQQFSQSTIHIARSRLPQVMPQTPRGIYGNNNNPYGYQSNVPLRIRSQVPTTSSINMIPENQRTLDIAVHPGNPNNAITTQPQPPPSLVNIKFKKLPFFELVEEVIKPSFLIGQEKCSNQNSGKGKTI